MRTKPVYMPIQKFIKVLYENCIYNKWTSFWEYLFESCKLLYKIGAAYTFFCLPEIPPPKYSNFLPLIIGKKYLWFLWVCSCFLTLLCSKDSMTSLASLLEIFHVRSGRTGRVNSFKCVWKITYAFGFCCLFVPKLQSLLLVLSVGWNAPWILFLC